MFCKQPLVLALLTCLACGCRAPRVDRYEMRAPAMGTEFRIVVYATQEARAGLVMQRAMDRIRELDTILSDYSASSELRRLTQGATGSGPVGVSRDLMGLLLQARAVSAQTEGAFDVTVGPLVRLWRRAFRQGELPTAEAIARARERVGMDFLALYPDTSSAWPRRSGMALDAGGIGKGYALDQALELIGQAGIQSALVEGGGDLAVSSAPPGQLGWRIQLDWGPDLSPAAPLILSHGAVATSGDLYQALTLEGVVYSHILDPRTGWAVRHGRRASVVAPSGALADALASALCVTGAIGIEAFIEGAPGVEASVLELDPANGETLSCESKGWAPMMGPAVFAQIH